MAEIAGDMVRVCHTLKIRGMALIAVRERQRVIAADMARFTLDRCVFSRQGKLRRVVVERCRLPCGRRVALLAILREAERGVIWVHRTRIVRAVAVNAIRR